MSDVLLIFVAEDLERAEALAGACEEAGLSIQDKPEGGYRAALAIWSEAASACRQFHAAAHDPLVDGKALIANLAGKPAPDFMSGAAVFDLADWEGAEDAAALKPLLNALQRRIRYAGILADMKGFAASPAPEAQTADSVLELTTPAPPEPIEAIEQEAEAEPTASVLYMAPEPEPEPEMTELVAVEALPEPEPIAPIEAEFEPVDAVPVAQPVAETKPDLPPFPAPLFPKAEPRPETRPRARTEKRRPKPARAPRVRPAPRRPDHKLHHLSQALLVSAGVFALVMIGGALTGALTPVRANTAAATQMAETTTLPVAIPALEAPTAEAPAALAEEAAPIPSRPATRRTAHRPAPVLPPKLARAIAAQQLERAQWALAQEKLVKDQPQRSAEVRLPASRQGLASSALSR